jgi:N-acetylneuraminic acid mutarotase
MSFQHEIYIIAALTGKYPHEQPIDHFLIFNPKTNTWRDGPSLPVDRLRGSAGICHYKNKIYVVSGIQDGHWAGHVTWFDEYDPSTRQWRKLPDAPRARDHFQSAMMGDKLYVAGGRTSHAAIGKVLDLTIGEVDVYDFKTGKWSTLANPLPTLRAGTTSVVKKPYLIVMNGESTKQVPAHAEVEALDTRTGNWLRLPDLLQGRHGTSAVYLKHKIYVMAGSANRGGGPELNTMECLDW